MIPRAHAHTDLAYRPDVDGLRAVAILGVVFYHAGIPGISGGFAGVDVFFVISGFLITQLLVKQIERQGTISLADFYARRIRRLLPALAVVLAVVTMLGAVLLAPTGEREDLNRSSVASLFFVANHYFLATTGGYFSGPAELRPLLHLWSLAVEEQFYLVWPLLLILIARYAAPNRRLLTIRVALVAIIAGSFIFSARLVHFDATAAFFMAPPRAWELGIGALLAILPLRPAARRAWLGALIGWLGLSFIVFAYVWIEPGMRFPGPGALPAVLGAALLIGGNSLAPDGLPRKLLSARPLVALGLVSYGWYLWHWPLLAFAHSASLMQSNVVTDSLLVLLALGLATLMLRFVENPIRYGGWLTGGENYRVLRRGAVTMAAIGALIVVTAATEASVTPSRRDRLALDIANDRPQQMFWDCFIDRPDWRGHLRLDKCRFGASDEPVSVALWGDSHALAWAPLLQELQRRGDVPAFMELAMSGCPPIPKGDERALGRWPLNCNQFRDQALKEILQLKSQGLKGVVLAGHWSVLEHIIVSRDKMTPTRHGLLHFLRGSRGVRKRAELARRDANLLVAGLQGTFEGLQRAGLKVLLLLDPPEFEYPLAECAYYNFDHLESCGIARQRYGQLLGDTNARIKSLAARFPAVRVVDPTDGYCDDRTCPPIVAGHPVFWDTDHVSASTARAFAAQVEQDFLWLTRS